VRKGQQLVNKLIAKKGADLALIYGSPGTGKSHFAKKVFVKHGWCYYRVKTMETPLSFLREIHRRLSIEMYGGEGWMSRKTSELLEQTIRLLQDISFNREYKGNPFVLIVDEVNLLMHYKQIKIIEIIREFRDTGLAKVIMIGEEDTYDKIKKYNSHFYSRVSNAVDFRMPSKDEVMEIIVGSSDVKMDKNLITMLIAETKGNLHDLESKIKDVEVVAQTGKIEIVSVKDIADASRV
jgi:Cdc6-like AAA superfamily ATPase